MAGQQQEEIETIRSRTIEVKLSDADVKRISEKAAAHGLTVGELMENFIGDLVCGTYSNGSDERMYAEQWFERCWFGMFPDLTFLRYLIEWGGLDEVIGAWENIKSTEENIQTSEEELASGVMKGRGGRTYTWKDLTDGKGTPCYSSKEEWEQEERTVISDWREEVEADKSNGKYATMPENTDGHILIVGGAGSGKTAAVAIPTLMSWKERVFAIDIKGELYEKTKKARGEATIKVFNPTDRNAYGYDPFYMLKTADDISSAARQLAMSIIPLPADVKDPFWIKGAQNMLTGFLIYLQWLGESFSSSMQIIKGTPTKELIEQIVADTNDKAKMEIMQFSGMDDKTLSGVFAELSNHITVFATSDDLQRALSGEGRSITPADIEGGYDIFCCIPEHKLEEWKDLLGMMCNQFLKSFERRGEGNKTPILFLIDEFPRLGKIEAISNGLATLRSKKIHIALIVQSKSQLNAIYGKDVAEVIADNCSYKAILKASEPETQEWCSKLVGTYDKKKISSNYNADILGVGKGQGTSSSTEEKRIIKPEEFAYLKDVVCVFPNGYKRLQKANYYEDKTFTDRM